MVVSVERLCLVKLTNEQWLLLERRQVGAELDQLRQIRLQCVGERLRGAWPCCHSILLIVIEHRNIRPGNHRFARHFPIGSDIIGNINIERLPCRRRRRHHRA